MSDVIRGEFGANDLWAIALGQHSEATAECKFGINDTIGTSVETIWSEGGLYVYPSSASIMKVASDSGTDTGDATVRITGLDTNYAEITDDVTLTGQASVNTGNSYLRINRMEMLAAASGQVGNVGIVYVGTGAISTGKPANVFGLIEATQNQSLVTPFTVHAAATVLITGMNYGTATKEVILELRVRELGSVFRTKMRMIFKDTSGSLRFEVPIKVPAKADVELRGFADSPSANVSASYSMILIHG